MWTQPARSTKDSKPLVVEKSVYHMPSSQKDSRFAVLSFRAKGVESQERLVFIHGAVSHGSRHADMFEWLIEKTKGRIEIFALDMVGHGLASGPRGHVDKFTHFVDDTLSFLHEMNSAEKPTYLMGHSMGGLIILQALLMFQHKVPAHVKAIILSNPCIRPHQIVDVPKLEDLMNGLADYLPTFRLPRIHKGVDLAYSSLAANSFETDPLIPRFITAQLAREIWIASQEIRSLSYFLNHSVLFLLSDSDQVVDREASMLFARGIDKQKVKLIEYNHTKHELLHETPKYTVWQNVLTWLEQL
jgi:alpha-beta hydrolase superfamily lysophospholipase